MRVIAIVNQKGGCGKTSTTINLAAVCAARGLRTLVVDMDPQSHCAAGLGVPDNAIERNVGDALLANLSRKIDRSSLVWEVSRNLDLLPSAMSLAGLEAPGGGLHRLEDKDRRLALLLKHLAPHYDRCLIDCPPTIGLLTYNALRAAGEAIIPVETGFFALRGAKKQWETIRHLVEQVNHPVTCYVLPTLYSEEKKIARDILDAIKRQFCGRVIPVVIREDEGVREAASFGQPLIEYAPSSPAVDDFEKLADWLDNHPADPPEIQVDITRSMTMPYHQEGLVSTPPQILQPVMQQNSVSAAGVRDPGSRAAEMARRVRELAIRRMESENQGTDNTATPDSKTQAPVTGVATASVVQARPETETTTPASKVMHVTAMDAATLASRRRATLVESKELPPAIGLMHTNLVRLYGAREASQGVLFVQPGAPGMCVCVAGDFNGWSATASQLRYNPQAGIYELLLPIPKGRYQYRLVIDGQWQADPYNVHRVCNQYGEDNNVIVVE